MTDALPPPKPSNRRLQFYFVALAVLGVLLLTKWFGLTRPLPQLGATTTVLLVDAGITLDARVDSGAQICSLHCEDIEIADATDDPADNVGKMVRFRVVNRRGESAWLETKLVDHMNVRTSAATAGRYLVELPIRVEGVEATVLISLNDRRSMRYPFLIGRNVLRDRFVVDVRRNDDDP